jgi:hypothetical protein
MIAVETIQEDLTKQKFAITLLTTLWIACFGFKDDMTMKMIWLNVFLLD